MAQPTSNPKIEELRFRIKTDPKSRLFYPLAEELRKISQWDESERVLRAGLEHHPTYLSAWVSLGRVLRDQHQDAGAIEAFKKALQLDPGNVVAARLLGDSYLTTGDRVEAIKKYKLVLALMPGDQEIESIIEGLDREINPIVPATVSDEEAGRGPGAVEVADSFSPPAPPNEVPSSPAGQADQSPFDEPGNLGGAQPSADGGGIESTPFGAADHPMDETRPQSRPQHSEDSPWADSAAEHQATMETPFAEEGGQSIQAPFGFPVSESVTDASASDAEPMRSMHSESPFEEPSGYTSAALSVENPSGMHVEEAPAVEQGSSMWDEPEASPAPAPQISSREELAGSASPSPWDEDLNSVPDEASVFASAGNQPGLDDNVSNTLTMADLYSRQGQQEQARAIYERILERDPSDDSVRSKLAALAAAEPAAEVPLPDERAQKLGNWLSKVGRREGGSV
ncbi:MAG: tetratricopeptide repeat protein [Thermoanaerobaculia bacterium]